MIYVRATIISFILVGFSPLTSVGKTLPEGVAVSSHQTSSHLIFAVSTPRIDPPASAAVIKTVFAEAVSKGAEVVLQQVASTGVAMLGAGISAFLLSVPSANPATRTKIVLAGTRMKRLVQGRKTVPVMLIVQGATDPPRLLTVHRKEPGLLGAYKEVAEYRLPNTNTLDLPNTYTYLIVIPKQGLSFENLGKYRLQAGNGRYTFKVVLSPQSAAKVSQAPVNKSRLGRKKTKSVEVCAMYDATAKGKARLNGGFAVDAQCTCQETGSTCGKNWRGAEKKRYRCSCAQRECSARICAINQVAASASAMTRCKRSNCRCEETRTPCGKKFAGAQRFQFACSCP